MWGGSFFFNGVKYRYAMLLKEKGKMARKGRKFFTLVVDGLNCGTSIDTPLTGLYKNAESVSSMKIMRVPDALGNILRIACKKKLHPIFFFLQIVK